MSEFGARLKQIRSTIGFTQREAAKHLGISERAYQHYEAGTREPNIETLISLANYFKISIEYLVVGYNDTVQDKREMKLLTIFSERLRECRMHKGLTQGQMARVFDVVERHWQKYESGERMPTLGGLLKIADFLDVSIDYLVGRSGNSKSHLAG